MEVLRDEADDGGRMEDADEATPFCLAPAAKDIGLNGIPPILDAIGPEQAFFFWKSSTRSVKVVCCDFGIL